MAAGLINVFDAVLAFTATNFDNLLILVVLFTTVGHGGPPRWKLVVGEPRPTWTRHRALR